MRLAPSSEHADPWDTEPRRAFPVTQADAQERGSYLEPMHRHVVELVGEGRTAKEIAVTLQLGVRYVAEDIIPEVAARIRNPGPLRATPSTEGHRPMDVLVSFYACLTRGTTAAPGPWAYLGEEGRDTPAKASSEWR